MLREPYFSPKLQRICRQRRSVDQTSNGLGEPLTCQGRFIEPCCHAVTAFREANYDDTDWKDAARCRRGIRQI